MIREAGRAGTSRWRSYNEIAPKNYCEEAAACQFCLRQPFSTATLLTLLPQVLPSVASLVVTTINSLLPMIITYITQIEQWEDRGDEIQRIVSRTFFAKTFTVIVLLFSSIGLVDPFFWSYDDTIGFGSTMTYNSIRTSTATPLTMSLSTKCRGDQWAEDFFILVMTEFATRVSMGLFTAFMAEVGTLMQSEGSKPVSAAEAKFFLLISFLCSQFISTGRES